MVNFKLKWILGQWKLLNRLAYPRASPHQKFNISKKNYFWKKKKKNKKYFFLKREGEMKYSLSIKKKRFTVISYPHYTGLIGLFMTLLLMALYRYFFYYICWLMDEMCQKIGSFFQYWILTIFSITFTKNFDANLLCDFQ